MEEDTRLFAWSRHVRKNSALAGWFVLHFFKTRPRLKRLRSRCFSRLWYFFLSSYWWGLFEQDETERISFETYPPLEHDLSKVQPGWKNKRSQFFNLFSYEVIICLFCCRMSKPALWKNCTPRCPSFFKSIHILTLCTRLADILDFPPLQLWIIVC